MVKSSQKWSKMAKNSQKRHFWPFFGPVKFYPPGVNHTSRGWIFLKISAFVQNYPNSNFTVCDRLRSPSKRVFFTVFPKKCFFYAFFIKKFFFFFFQKMIFGSRGRYGFRFGSLRCVLMPYGPIENRSLFYPSLLLGDSNVQTCP